MSGGHKAGGHKGGHKKHAAHDEEHENHERWLVSYADMMTLLMVLFVVLFAMSQVDAAKFEALADGLAKGFGSPSVAMSSTGSKVTDGSDASGAVSMGGPGAAEQVTGKTTVDTQDATLKAAVQDADRARQQQMQNHAEDEVKNFEKVKQQIQDAAAKEGMADSVKFTVDERGLVVTIVTSEVVFAGDRADLLPAGKRILDGVAPALNSLPNKIEVDGHTNQLNVPTVNYPSAWELSTARASDVVRYLIKRGLAANRLSAVGYAGEKALYPPSDPRAVTLNRRVEIIVQSNLAPAEKALLPAAAGNE
jgi:chemotaxis protein MotB